MRNTGGDQDAGRGRLGVRILANIGLWLLALSLTGIIGLGAAAQSPRAAMHDNFARMVFDWDAPVTYSAEIVNGDLLVRFDRPIIGDARSLLKPLATVLRGVSLSADRKSASFVLAHPVSVKAFLGNNNSVVIDLSDAGPPSAASAAGVVPAAGSTIEARASDHGGYVRLVFDWPGPVGYRVDKQGGRASIAFTKSGKLDLALLQSGLPGDIVIAVDPTAKSLTLNLQVPPDTRLRHFVTDNKVVVDVVRASGSAALPEGDKIPLAPPPNSEPVPPSLKPLTPQDKPKTPEESLHGGLSPVKPTLDPTAKANTAPVPAAMPAVAAAAGAPALSAPVPAAPPAPPAKVFSLSIPMTKPAAAAVFQRAGYLWLLFDRRQEIDTGLLRRLGGEAVLAVEQIPNKDATVLRLLVQPDFYPSLRKEGLLWVVDLTQQFTKPKDIIPVLAPVSLPSGIGMSLKAPDSGSLINVTDPEVGDIIKVVPVIPLSQGVYPGRDTPDLELLPSAQGIAIIPHVDGLDIRTTRGGVSITMLSGAGLRFSSELDAVPRDGAGASASLLDIGTWKRGAPESFLTNRKLVMASLYGVSTSKRALANLQAARFFLANGFGAEAIGHLRLAALDQPDLADQPGFKAIKGAAEMLMSQWDLAQGDLDSPLLQGDGESQMWRSAAHAGGSDQPAEWDKKLADGLPYTRNYPHRLKWLIATLAVKAAVAAGDDQGANQALGLLDREESNKMELPEREYLHGAYDEMAGHFDKALDEYESAGDGDNREFRALGKFANTELSLRTGKITAKEAADQLDKLRFSWREENFEFNLLRRYAELERDAGDYPSALRALRSLVNYYPDDKGTPAVTQMMTGMFNMLYLDGQADTMPPVSAIGLYDEFRDLTPTGPRGDEMIRKLADRLAKVDLLDRAAELLKHQVTYRLQGIDKARVGAQLALLDLINQQPQAALDGLAVSDMPGLPDDLKRQRRQLQARALSDLDRVAEAVTLLDSDMSPESLQLRSEIHWKAQDWPSVAQDFEAMLARPERGSKLDDSSARNCLSWATALVLGNDERGLAALRRNYGAAMAGTPYQEGFNLLTSALDRETPNLPAVIAKIKEAESFKSFLSDYRKRVQMSGLSAIN